MNPWLATFRPYLGVCLGLALGYFVPRAGAVENPAHLAEQAKALLVQKCASCHGPQAKKIKKFGYVDDLAKLAANSKLVVPGAPDKSALFTSVQKDEMPPDDSDIPALSAKEKDLLRQWIAVGAPSAGTLVSATQPGIASDSPAHAPAASKLQMPMGRRLQRWIGKFHPLVAHFPIALFVTAAMAELLYLRTGRSGFDGTVRFSLMIGAAGALGTAFFGWMAAYFHTSSQLLESHRWLGSAAALWTVPVAIYCEAAARRSAKAGQHWQGGSRWTFRAMLLVGVAMISLAAHMGGQIVHGEDYFHF